MKTMKNILIVLAALAGLATSKSFAQPNQAESQEAMKKFSMWIGTWKGEGSYQMGPGEPQKTSVHESIEMKLDGTILLMQGIGKSIDPATKKETVTHEAMGILHYDQASKEYKFRSYLKTGQMTDAWFMSTGDNQWQWGFDVPQGKIRYIIVLDPVKKTWNEIGEFSADGNNWNKFLEMNLLKIK